MHRDKGLVVILVLLALIAPVIAMAGGSVKLSWNANTENDVTGYRVYYGTSSGNYSQVADAGKVTTFTVNGLQDGSTYYFVLTAYDNAGNESGYSAEVPATILDTTPPLISAVAAINLTTSGATITWTTDESSDSQVDYGISTSYGASSSLNSQMVTSHSVTLSGLSASATYHFRVNSRDAASRIATSNDFTFITLAPDAVPPVISNISASSISHNSAIIKWTTNEPADTQVEYGESAAYGSLSPLAQNLQTDHTVALSGLSTVTSYHFRVLSRDGGGNLTVSSDQTFTTTEQSAFVRRVNAGGAAFTDASSQAWSADQEYGTGLDWGYDYGQARTQSNEIANTNDDALFQSNRTGAGGYRFEVPSAGVYRVKLCFAEIEYTSAGQRVFDVTIENKVVIDNLDLVATVGSNVATTYTFDAEVTDGRLAIKFVAVTGEPTISAIEMTPADAGTNLDTTPPTALNARLTTPNSLMVSFNESISSSSGQNVTNYTINPAVSITSATLQNDQRTVLVSTAAHTAGQNYTITVRNIADVATPSNVMSAPAALSYSYQAADVTPPQAVSATIIDRNTVNVLFSETVATASAQNAANYSISPAVQVVSATLQPDQKTVKLATDNHTSGQGYTLTVRNVTDRSNPPNAMASANLQYTYQAVDVTPPSVLSASATNKNTVTVLFSEAVTTASSQSLSNYSITSSVAVQTAALQSDNRTVILTTGDHTSGSSYSLTVSNISDRASTPNVMANPATVSYSFQTDDSTPPRIASVRIDSPTQVVVVFSELVTVASAQTTGNYSISDGVSVNNARLASNGLEVELTTSAHQFNHDYQVVVSNVRDRSAAGNVIAANSSAPYRLAGNDNGNGGSVVNSLSMGNYRIDSLRVGDSYYVDRSYRVNHIPNGMRNTLWIRTANADKANNQNSFLEFNLNREVDVYIAYDSRASKVPAWLSSDFDKTNDYIGVSETAGRLDLWRGHFLPGRVRLGGNLANGASNVNSMYVVLIDDLSGPADDKPEAPRSFVLYQNYPNPFNPRTEITFYVERESNVVVNIYNSLGQVVRTLYDGRQAQGQHRLTWDAKNDRGNSVPSGTYMYTLEIRDQMSSGGVVMNSAVSRQSRSMTLLK